MFKVYNKVRMHDTDMAGILYYPRLFRFVNEAMEDLMESEGFELGNVFHREDFVFVLVHVEADYKAPLTLGDQLEIQVGIEKIGNTSFTMAFFIYLRSNNALVGKAKTVHCCLTSSTREKITIPERFKIVLQKHLI